MISNKLKLLTILFIALTFHGILSCGPGCLKCDKETAKCLICDFQQFYFLVDGYCIESIIPNCLLAFIPSTCAICKAGYYPFESTCEEIDEYREVINCEYYSEDQRCIKCQDNYYLDQNKCKKSSKKIENCVIYRNDGKCAVCAIGKPNEEADACPNYNKYDNCDLYNYPLYCSRCQNNINIPRINLNLERADYTKIFELYRENIIRQYIPFDIDIYKIVFPHCHTIHGETCIECEEGYFLDYHMNCQKNPTSKVSSCLNYSEEDKCEVCKNGYKLNDYNQCDKISLPHCLKYDHITGACTKCDDEYYVDVNLCEPRNYYDKKCLEYDQKADECLKCEEGYFFEAVHHKHCTKGIKKCKVHTVTSAFEVVCDTCFEGFAPSEDGSRCLSTDKIPHCKIYESQYECRICEDDYLLIDSSCLIKPSKHLVAKDYCGYELMPVKFYDKCEAIKPDKCVKKNKKGCLECLDYHYVDEFGKCQKGEIEHCKKYINKADGPECMQCNHGYVLYQSSCRIALDYFNKNCDDITGEDCLKCKSGYLRVPFLKDPMTIFENIDVNKENDDELFINTFLSNYLKNRNITIQPIKEENELTSDSDNTFSDTTLTFCSNSYNEKLDEINKCVIFDTLKNACVLCEEGYGVDNAGLCIKCDVLDLKGSKCIEETSNDDCLQKNEDGECYICKPNIMYKILDQQTETVIIWKDKVKHIYNIENHQPKVCDAVIDSECDTKYCQAVIEISETKSCCNKCIAGKTGILQRIDDIYYLESCNDNLLYCDLKSAFKGVNYEIQALTDCVACKENRVLLIETKENEYLTSCEYYDDPLYLHCQIWYGGECYHCKPGYRKNEDNTCTRIEYCDVSQTVDKCDICQEGYVVDLNGNSCIENTIEHCWISDEPKKCLKCQDGFLLYDNRCFKLDDYSCNKYNSNNCAICKNNSPKIIISRAIASDFYDGLQSFCVKMTGNNVIPNCDTYQDQYNCQTCQNGFMLQLQSDDTKICIKNFGTEHCLIADADINCLKCKDGYYQENGICVKGQIDHCIIYDDPKQCSKCTKDYFVYNGLCYPEPRISDCQDLQISDGLICNSCISGFHQVRYTFNQLVCLKINEIPNCEVQDKENCTKCKERFYLRDGKCLPRKYASLNNCAALKMDKDECKYCNHGYHLDSNKDCVRITEGILGCKEYKSASTCIKCKTGYYMKNGICKFYGNSIEGCITYNNKGCEECDNSNFILDDNKCVKTQKLNNCISYIERNKCGECDNVTYLENEECKKVDDIIPKCKTYENSSICKECEPNYILTDNRCRYINDIQFDSNYQQRCFMCKPSFFLDFAGVCLQVSDRNWCLLWNDKIDACEICVSGAYQNIHGTCTPYMSTDTSSNQPVFTTPKSILLLSVVMSILTVILHN